MDKKKKTEWHQEGFPEPRTFPDGWDGQALSSSKGDQPKDELDVQKLPEEEDADWCPEKFPKPRTFPKNWSIKK
jgi:hypothetical protein